MKFAEISEWLRGLNFDFVDSNGRLYTWENWQFHCYFINKNGTRVKRGLGYKDLRLMREICETLDLHRQTKFYRDNGHLETPFDPETFPKVVKYQRRDDRSFPAPPSPPRTTRAAGSKKSLAQELKEVEALLAETAHLFPGTEQKPDAFLEWDKATNSRPFWPPPPQPEREPEPEDPMRAMTQRKVEFTVKEGPPVEEVGHNAVRWVVGVLIAMMMIGGLASMFARSVSDKPPAVQPTHLVITPQQVEAERAARAAAPEAVREPPPAQPAPVTRATPPKPIQAKLPPPERSAPKRDAGRGKGSKVEMSPQ